MTNVYVFLCLCALVPPVFRQKITPLDINIGSHAKFECEIEDAPNVTFKWYRSGAEIRQSEKYRIVSHRTSSSLELMKPVKADSGEFTCKASNQHGTASCTASLIVTGKTQVGTFVHACVGQRERELYTYCVMTLCGDDCDIPFDNMRDQTFLCLIPHRFPSWIE